MGIFEENKKKRQEYIDKFYVIWDRYCSEHYIHHHDDKAFGLDFNGEERQYLTNEETLLGYYLAYYGGLESEIPQKINMDYSEEVKNHDSIACKALSLFYQTSCSLKDSLEVNDITPKEYKNKNGEYLQFYFRTMNKFKEFEELTNCKNKAKKEVLNRFKNRNIEFDEKSFDEDFYINIYGNFYINNECELYLKCNHYEMEEPKVYDLKKYLSKEDIDVFFNEVKNQTEWQEFESNQECYEIQDIEI